MKEPKGGVSEMMKTRRVVTGHNQDGRSVVKWDSELESRPGKKRFENVEL